MIWLLAASIASAQSTVVAVGDDLVAAPPNEPEQAESVAGGWVAVLADCLEERAPRAWTVVDRAVTGETAASARARVAAIEELGPRVVVLGLGGRELSAGQLDGAALGEEVGRLVGELRKESPPPGVLLVGPIAPADDVELGRRARAYNGVLAELASRADGVHHLDLQRHWPEARPATALTAEGARLTDQGHARVAAAVCDAIVASWPAAPGGAQEDPEGDQAP